MRRSTLLLVGMAYAALLYVAAPPTVAVQVLRSAATATDPTGPLLAALSLLGWALTAWVLLVALLTLGSGLPGVLGRLLSTVLAHAAPAAVRRVVALSLGVGIALGGVGAGAARAESVTTVASSSTSGGDLSGQLDWPGLPGAAPPTTGPAGPPATPAAPTPAPGTPAAGGAPGAPAAVSTAEGVALARQVVVRPGDTLWGLASASLPARASAGRIARAWPTWWAANRAVIGDDPNLLHPGQRLQPPDPTALR